MKSILLHLVSRLTSLFQKEGEGIPENGLGLSPDLFEENKQNFPTLLGIAPIRMRNQFAKVACLSLLLLFTAVQGWAQLSIPTAGTAVTQNFDIGSSATAALPTGFKVSAAVPDWNTGTSATTVAAGTSGTGALTGTSTGGVYNFSNGVTASATDRAVGFLTTGSFASPNSIILKFTNNTGATVNNLSITFDYEKYRAGTRAWNMTFFHGATSNPTTAATAGDQAYAADGANAVVNPSTSISKTVNLTGLTIADGGSYYLKWTSTGLAGSTNSQGIGLDNFSITATSASTPSIATSGTLVAVNTTYGSPSAETTFSVSGANITGGILVTPPAGYEVSLTTGGTFTPTVTVGSTGTISSTPVYVRLAATATFAGSPYSGNIVCSSSGASNANVATVSSAVAKKAATISGAVANNKPYDRTTAATISGATASGTVNGDIITVSGGGTFDTFNVGTGKTVTAALTLNGVNASSYTLTQPSGLTANITPKDLTLASAAANNKIYDGNTNATLSGTLTGVISPDDVSLNASASFDTYLVGTAIPVTSFSTLAGANAGNYNLINPIGLVANITPKALTITGATAANKLFDGNTDAVLTGTLTGVIFPDDVFVNLSGTFASSAIGVNIPVTSTSTLGGADIANYSLTQPTGLTANISAAALLPQAITFDPLADVVYGSADFDLTATADSGLAVTYASSDPLVATIVAGASPGTYKVHVVGVGFTTITASQSGDATYDSATPVDQNLNVTTKELTVTATAANKVYDGNDIAVVTGTLNGIVGTDDVTFVGSGNFETTAVANGITVFSSSTLGGTKAGNYTLAQPALSADITPLALTVTGAVASNKVYNNSTAATITGATLQGVIAPDVVTVSGGGTFASKDVANGIAVTPALTLGGANAGNYTLTQPGGLAANITPLGLTISGLSGVSRVYDRTTTATLAGTASLPGVLGLDVVSLTGPTSVTFANKTVGTAKLITVLGYGLAGAQAGNYTVAQPTGLTADITPFSVTIFSAAATNKVFDGNTTAVITGTIIGTLGADVVTLIGTGTFASAAVGSNIAVTSTSTVGGTDGANYVINPQPTGLTANITAAPTVLASQDFEVTPASPTLTFTTSDVATPGASSGFSSGQTGSTTDSPSLTNLFASGARGYRFQGPSTGVASRTITFSAVDASLYSNIQASFRVAGMSLGSNANGIDGATGTTILGASTPVDFALIEVSPDGGTTWYKQGVVSVTTANSNVRWSFAPTGAGSKVYAANDTYANFVTTGTGAITSGATAVTTATVTSLPSSANLRIRITLETNSPNESWIIDDVLITGSLGAACTTPDALNSLTASNGSSLSVVNWAYGTCYDEALVVASTAAFTAATPTGDGSAYTVNSQSFTDVLNSSFDGGKVVYKGALSTATITSLTNGTPYNFKVFVRKGTNWTTGSTTSATPVEAFYVWDADAATTTATGGTGTWDSSATSNWRTPNDTGTLVPWNTNTGSLNAILGGTAGTVTVSTGIANTTPNLYVNTSGYTLAVTGTTAITLPAITTVLGNNVAATIAANVNTVTPASGTLNVGSISGTGTAAITIPSAQSTLGVAQRINMSRAGSTIGVPITITSAGGTGTAAIAQIVATATGTSLSSAATITNNTAIKTGLGATSGFDISANGAISGSADLIFAASPAGGAGTVNLNAANTYTGATLFNLSTSGVIKLGNASALPAATNVTMGYSSGNGGILDLNGFSQTVSSLSSGLGGGSIRNNAVATDATLTINGATSTTFGLAITDGTSKIALAKAGTSTLTLSSVSNTYSGGTTISGGTLQLGAAGVLANAGSLTLNGGTFDTAGFTETVGTLNVNAPSFITLGAANHTLTIANSSAVTWAGASLTISGWNGIGGQTNATGGKIQVGVGGLSPAQLAKISFVGHSGTPIILASGELVPPGPILAVTAGSLNHGSVCVNAPAPAIVYTITNTGDTATGVTVTSNSTEFVVSNAPTTIAGGSTATYTVTFTPNTSGVRNGTITISTTTPNSNSPVNSAVSGTGAANVTYYADTDNDGFGDLANPVVSCTGQPALTATNSTDCAPADGTKWRLGNFYTDADNDGYNNGAPQTELCYGASTPTGYTASNIGTDCLDSNFEVNPNHVEVMANGIDDNCDGTVDEVAPTTSLQPTQCGITLTNIAQAIYANVVTGAVAATGYRFEVTEVGNPSNVKSYDSAINSFNLLNLAGGAAYNTTYSIRVAVKTAPGFWRAYSTACTITTPALPETTNVSSPACGITLSNIATTIYCDAVSNATGYRFRVTDGVTTNLVETTVNRFNLTNVNANFGTTYTIDVQLKFGTTWQTTWGTTCSFTTPATPGTSNVSAAQCGINITNLWATIYATQISAATGYRFEVTKGAQTVFYDTANPRFSLRNITVPGFTTTNASYSIRVAILFNSIYQPFGAACTITTNGASRVTNTPIEVFEVKAYPNPFANNFKLDINTSSENNVSLKVYDMIGRQIETRQSDVADMTSLEIGNLYPSGVYNVIVTQGENVKTLRIVKR